MVQSQQRAATLQKKKKQRAADQKSIFERDLGSFALLVYKVDCGDFVLRY
jgi:hypothetical protein